MTPPAASASAFAPVRNVRRIAVSGTAVVLLCALAVTSLFIGSGGFSPREVIEALTGGGDGPVDLIVREFRLPRTLLAILVGAALGVAGTLIQALTRNPLADPGILGVNAGAYAAVVGAAAVAGPAIGFGHIWTALAGALVTSVAVYVIGTTGPAAGSPAKLVLTGVALGALLTGIGLGVTLVFPEVFDRVRFWNAGSLQGRGFDEFWTALPFITVGLVLAALLPRALNALSLGDDVAVALGARPALTRVTGLAAVTLLCGAATAVAGPVSFLGLVTPHALRLLVGPDHRWLVPLSIVGAASLMLLADIAGRLLTGAELPAGVVTAFIGAPVLVFLARRQGARPL